MPKPPIQTRLANRGRWALKLGLLFFVLGLLRQDMVLIHLSLFLLFLLPFCDLLARMNLRGVEYQREVPERPFARETFSAVMRLSNTRRIFTRFTVTVDDTLLANEVGNWMVESIGPRGEASVTRESHMPHRGRVESGKVSLRSNFPFGLVEASRTWSEPVEMVVYPAPLYPNQASQSADNPVHDLRSSLPDLPLDTGEFRSLREFRSGDRVRSIHWGASARQGGLMVREFDPPLGSVYSFVFHSYCPRGVLLAPQNFERCMQLLCGFFLECRERDIPFEFTASFNTWKTIEVRDPQQLDDVLELLACAPPRTERSGRRLLERVRRHARHGRCFIISNTPIDHWAGLLQQLDVPVDCVDAHTWRSRDQLTPKILSGRGTGGGAQ